MTEPIYFRTVITTNTSTPSYNEYGERRCEVNMQLPANLIARADDVVKCDMSVMKMTLPMETLRVASVPLSAKVNSYTNYLHEFITALPLQCGANQWQGYLEKITEPNIILSTNPIAGVQPAITASHYLEQANAATVELERGYHDFRTLEDICSFLSESFTKCLRSATTSGLNVNYKPRVYLGIRSDNTVYMDIYNFDADKVVLPAHTSWFNFKSGNTRGTTQVVYSDTAKTPNPSYKTQQFMFLVTEGIRNLCHTLPWIKVNASMLSSLYSITLSSYFSTRDLYLLDTRQGKLSLGSEYSIQVYDESTTPATLTFQHFCRPVTIDFVESDAVSWTQISAFTLTMEGASCTQEVFPINIVSQNASQITSFPIINVYLPLKSRPSDNKTDMIVAKDVFSSAAPISVDPQVLKERNLTFKLFYIMSNGERRQVYIPGNRPFFFELCFAIWFKD